ncbi:MAG: hypothetical protein JWQ97_1715 [Phenylobacterium sp.]|nr:hypothetical protein [Phenylobacterium sp.]
MFEGWDSFYLLVGSASGALIGLLFVVVTLTAGQDQDQARRGSSVFMTPLVYHFAAVLVVSGVALTPRLAATPAGALIGLCAVAGFGHAVRVMLALATGRVKQTHWSDIWWYGVAPNVAYLGLAAAALGVAERSGWAANAAAVGAMALLLITIRNAWDLVTWLAPRAKPSEGA